MSLCAQQPHGERSRKVALLLLTVFPPYYDVALPLKPDPAPTLLYPVITGTVQLQGGTIQFEEGGATAPTLEPIVESGPLSFSNAIHGPAGRSMDAWGT